MDVAGLVRIPTIDPQLINVFSTHLLDTNGLEGDPLAFNIPEDHPSVPEARDADEILEPLDFEEDHSDADSLTDYLQNTINTRR